MAVGIAKIQLYQLRVSYVLGDFPSQHLANHLGPNLSDCLLGDDQKSGYCHLLALSV